MFLVAGINTGILLLRNDANFSPKFWKDVAVVSRINQNVKRNSSTPEGQIKVRTLQYSDPRCSQMVSVSLLKTLELTLKSAAVLIGCASDGVYCLPKPDCV